VEPEVNRVPEVVMSCWPSFVQISSCTEVGSQTRSSLMP
jgi:hypothetical protein